jgi:hypothetical protein
VCDGLDMLVNHLEELERNKLWTIKSLY